MPHSRMKIAWRTLWLGGLIVLVVLCAGCGGASGSATYASTNSNAAIPAAPANRNSDSASGGQAQASGVKAPDTKQAPQGKQNTTSNIVGQRYLIKSLNVGMQVKDTVAAADELQSWISATDPQAISVGTNYQQVDDNLYRITLTFSVRSTLYPQIYSYLRDYPAAKKQGKLISFNESVQDVTNDYVDTNARLQNLQTERDRILTLMKQAQSMSDVITVEQKLTDVEGQIESIQAHLNQLKDQVTFYNVTINLQPVEVYTEPTPPGWSIGQVFHDAFAASISFAQGLATFLVWLLAFSVYVIPILLILWFARKLRNQWRRPMARPKVEATAPQAEPAPNTAMSPAEKTEENTPEEPAATPPTGI